MENSVKKSVCCSCQSSKATLECGLCVEPVCKKCAEFLAEESFAFLPYRAADISHSTYCRLCYDAKIAPQVADYNAMIEKAKEVFVFQKIESKISRLIKRIEEPFVVENSLDRQETLLRLAFLAALGDFNVIVDVDITSQKVRNGGYQTLHWKGTAIPSNVDPRKLEDKNKWSTIRSDGAAYRTSGAKR